MSISELSRLTNISRQSIYKWFATDHISPQSITKLARSLAVDEDWLRYGVKPFITRENNEVKEKSAFIKVIDNHAFDDTKRHLDKLDVLVGAYHFNNGKITCYNTSSVLNPKAPMIDSFNDIGQHIYLPQLKRIKLQALKLLKQLSVDDFYLSTFHNAHIYQCTLLPIFNHTHLVEGISFCVKKILVNQDKLSKCLKAKCDACIDQLCCDLAAANEVK